MSFSNRFREHTAFLAQKHYHYHDDEMFVISKELLARDIMTRDFISMDSQVLVKDAIMELIRHMQWLQIIKTAFWVYFSKKTA